MSEGNDDRDVQSVEIQDIDSSGGSFRSEEDKLTAESLLETEGRLVNAIQDHSRLLSKQQFSESGRLLEAMERYDKGIKELEAKMNQRFDEIIREVATLRLTIGLSPGRDTTANENIHGFAPRRDDNNRRRPHHSIYNSLHIGSGVSHVPKHPTGNLRHMPLQKFGRRGNPDMKMATDMPFNYMNGPLSNSVSDDLDPLAKDITHEWTRRGDGEYTDSESDDDKENRDSDILNEGSVKSAVEASVEPKPIEATEQENDVQDINGPVAVVASTNGGEKPAPLQGGFGSSRRGKAVLSQPTPIPLTTVAEPEFKGGFGNSRRERNEVSQPTITPAVVEPDLKGGFGSSRRGRMEPSQPATNIATVFESESIGNQFGINARTPPVCTTPKSTGSNELVQRPLTTDELRVLTGVGFVNGKSKSSVALKPKKPSSFSSACGAVISASALDSDALHSQSIASLKYTSLGRRETGEGSPRNFGSTSRSALQRKQPPRHGARFC